MTEQYEDYLDILFSQLSNSGKLNEFILCTLKKEDRSVDLDTYKCKVYKFHNNDLSIEKPIDIPIYGYDYSLEFYFFDENKIVFYIYDIYSNNEYYDGPINNNNIYIFYNMKIKFYHFIKIIKIANYQD